MPWHKIDVDTGLGFGQCCLVSERGRLSIVIPARYLENGKRKIFSLGLPDSPANRAIAIARLQSLQADINLGQFDETLQRYRSSPKPNKLIHSNQVISEISLLALWAKYFEYKRPQLKESTLYYLKKSVEEYLKKSGIKSPYQALELREWLLCHTTESMAKRVLIYVNAAFKWGLKHKLLKGDNPYDGMPNELKHHYQIDPTPNAFTAEQKEQVLESFSQSQDYAHYTNLVRFLFLTGCRPSEAIGIRWGDISKDLKKITFNGSICELGGIIVRAEGSKNNRSRDFPCNAELQAFLRKIKPDAPEEKALLFPSPTGKVIRYNNFSKRAWDTIVNPIKTDTTPYSCRDTFITEQIIKGISPAIVAKWVDNSVNMIEKHYLDLLNISHILPL